MAIQIEIDPSVNRCASDNCLYGLKNNGPGKFILVAEEKTQGLWASIKRWFSSTNYDIIEIKHKVIDTDPKFTVPVTRYVNGIPHVYSDQATLRYDISNAIQMAYYASIQKRLSTCCWKLPR